MTDFHLEDVTIPGPSGRASDNHETRGGSDAEYAQLQERVASPPAVHTLKEQMPPPYDEKGEWGTCTAQALAGCYAHLQYKKTGDWVRLSRLQLFYQGRFYQNHGRVNAFESNDPRCWNWAMNCWLGYVIGAFADHGACREEFWPFNLGNRCPLPPAAVNAPKERLDHYWSISNSEDWLANPGRGWAAQQEVQNRIMRSIWSGSPVMFAIQLHENFAPQGEDDEIPPPVGPEWMIHCMIIYGYDTNTGMYKVQNSWGADWGYEGKCRIPMEWINERGRDFYALRPPE
jgi:hypothetical protein